MSGVIAWFAGNRVAANVLMILLLGGGMLAIPSLKMEIFPELDMEVIRIQVPYPGAAAEDVEEGICRRIEEELSGVIGIERLRSTAAEGMGVVNVEVLGESDVDQVLRDVASRVDAIDSFPVDAEEPIVERSIRRNQVINVAVSGQLSERDLKETAERVREDLLALDSITQVEVAAARPYQLAIEVSPTDLEAYGISFAQVATAVRQASLDVPGGRVRTRGGEVLLTTEGQRYRADEFAELPLLVRADGTRLQLGDVADVRDTFEETDQAARFDGQSGVVLQVFRVGNENALEIAEEVKAFCASSAERLPAEVRVTPWRDDSRLLKGRLETLLRNAWQGLLLVLLVLTLFLRVGLAFWVTLGIPISFLGALAVSPLLGTSINVLSLFAFILVLGIVVDDAIVVGEAVFARIQRGETGAEAVAAGARGVGIPVVFAVLTTICAFLPLGFLEGSTGDIWRVIPLVVIPTLLFSLVESLWILPAHLVHLHDRPATGAIGRAWERFQGVFSGGLLRFIDRVYRPVLRGALRLRYLVLSAAVALCAITVGMVGHGLIGFTFFPSLPADDVSVALTMPLGTPAEVTAQVVAEMERAALEVGEQLGDRDPSAHMLASVGEQPWRTVRSGAAGGQAKSFVGAHLGEVHVALIPSEKRSGHAPPDEFVALWREAIGTVPGAEEVDYSSVMLNAGNPVDVELRASDRAVLQAAADDLRTTLGTIPGLFDIADTFRSGKRQVEFTLTPEGEAAGVTLSQLGSQVRQAYQGEIVQRVQRGREELEIVVRYPEEERTTLASLEDMRIVLPGGQQAALGQVAKARWTTSASSIERTDRRRTLGVSADLDSDVQSAGAVNELLAAELMPDLMRRYPGLDWSFQGEREEQQKTFRGLVTGGLIALLGIFALMAIPFRSYVQPLIVMTAIPFGIVGALWGHVLTGLDASMLSILGMVALAGVVVNDNLVLVDTINQLRRKPPGGGGEQGPGSGARGLLGFVQEAGVSRFRPILLTSMTTFAGLTPLMLETSLQAQFLIPMAVSLAFGVMFSTVVSLVLVPCLYLALEDLLALFGRARSGASAGEQPQPATP